MIADAVGILVVEEVTFVDGNAVGVAKCVLVRETTYILHMILLDILVSLVLLDSVLESVVLAKHGCVTAHIRTS